MTDQFPWGLWIGFDCLCGVMLAAGGFCMVGAVYLFNVESLHSVVRPAVSDRIPRLSALHRRPAVRPRPAVVHLAPAHLHESALGHVRSRHLRDDLHHGALLRISADVFERLNLKAPIKWIHKIYPVLIVLGILLSTLHQSSLGSLYLIMPSKLHPFWYTPALPFFFFRIGGRGRPGDDDLRVHAKRQSPRAPARTSGSGHVSAALCWSRSG